MNLLAEGAGESLEQSYTNELESLLFDVHSALRDVDGLHADAALDEVCKLLFIKIYQENGLLGFSLDPDEYVHGSSLLHKVRASVTQRLGPGSEPIMPLHPNDTPSVKSALADPLKLSGPALSRALRILSKHRFESIDDDLKGRAFQKMIQPSLRAGLGQYFTPHPIVELMTDVVSVNSQHALLDPFSGSSHFLKRAAEKAKDLSVRPVGVEKSARMARVALASASLGSTEPPKLLLGDSLVPPEDSALLRDEEFDVILTNPPFGSVMTPESLERLPHYDLAGRKKKRVPMELLGLERSIQLLRPGGRLGIVLPESVFSGQSMAEVRSWIIEKCHLVATVSLPPATFSPYGANVKTGILFLEKRSGRGAVQPGKAAHETMAMVIEDVGYDGTGRATGDSDCAEAVQVLRRHVAKRGWLDA